MNINLDRSFCASPECRNVCERQLTQEIKDQAQKVGKYLSLAYFCGVPKQETK